MERIAGSATGCPNHVNWGLNPNEATVRDGLPVEM